MSVNINTCNAVSKTVATYGVSLKKADLRKLYRVLGLISFEGK